MPTTNVFVDSNVLLYTIDVREPTKREIAQRTVAELGSALTCSTQVLQEFYSIATRKMGVEPALARGIVASFDGKRVFQPNVPLLLRAIDTGQRYRISFWDSMIVEAASASGCGLLLSEDLSDGQVMRGVTIKNPFRDGS